MSWHIDFAALRNYTDGTLVDAQQFSIEAHLTECPDCRSNLSAFVDKARLDRAWEAIEGETMAPGRTPVERALMCFGVADHVSRLLAATPSLRRSWLLAVTAVLALGVGVAHGAEGGYLFFLAVAPLLPLAGIAAAFGPGVDPTYEIGIAAPMHSFGLLLIRAAAVLGSTIGLGVIAALFLPESWAALLWLLPSLGLVTSSLALSTFLSPIGAAAMVAIAWLMGVGLVTWSASGALVLRSAFGGTMQIALLIVTLGSGLLLVARREHFERGESQ